MVLFFNYYFYIYFFGTIEIILLSFFNLCVCVCLCVGAGGVAVRCGRAVWGDGDLIAPRPHVNGGVN